MAKTVVVSSKFTEEECDIIDSWAAAHEMTRSAALHKLVMGACQKTEMMIPEKEDNSVAQFRFTENFSYFFKERIYNGFIREDEAHIRFGGEWMIYKLDELPVEVL